jgi:hypothetical protein
MNLRHHEQISDALGLAVGFASQHLIVNAQNSSEGGSCFESRATQSSLVGRTGLSPVYIIVAAALGTSANGLLDVQS